MTDKPHVFACPPPADPHLPDDPRVCIHPGFGIVSLCRNGVEVDRDIHGDRVMAWYTKRIREASAPHQPAPVWTLHIDGPLSNQVYAYTPDGEWTLIENGKGFA